LNVEQAMWSDMRTAVLCDSCARNRNIAKDFPDLKIGFERVTLLTQFIFLLRVALTRLGSILRDGKALPHTSGISSSFTTPPTFRVFLVNSCFLDEPTLSKSNLEDGHKSDESIIQRPAGSIRSRSFGGEEEASSYAKTIDGVRRIRSSHLDHQLLNSAQRARQSQIIDGPEADSAIPTHRDGPADSPANSHDDRFLSAGQPVRRPSSRLSAPRIQIVEDKSYLDTPKALEDDRALTLDDLPKILAVEQAKERDRSPPGGAARQRSLGNVYDFNFMASDPVEDFTVSIDNNPLNDNTIPPPNTKYFSELSALEYFIVRHIAVLALETMMNERFDLEELLDLIETRKGTIWERFGKAFRSGGDKKNAKKKGTSN